MTSRSPPTFHYFLWEVYEAKPRGRSATYDKKFHANRIYQGTPGYNFYKHREIIIPVINAFMPMVDADDNHNRINFFKYSIVEVAHHARHFLFSSVALL